MDESELTALYRTRVSVGVIRTKYAIWQILCKHYLCNFIKPSDTVIDVACGFGEFSNHICAARKIAIDANPDVKRHLNSDIQFILCSATQIATKVRVSADIVFTSNFLEHLPDKATLEKVIDQAAHILKPGGRFLILGPNLRYLPGKYWDYYDHELGLTHLSLCEVLVLKAFAIELCVARFLPYTINSLLPTHPLLVWIYLKVPVLWRLFGKQFFIVARKPEACLRTEQRPAVSKRTSE